MLYAQLCSEEGHGHAQDLILFFFLGWFLFFKKEIIKSRDLILLEDEDDTAPFITGQCCFELLLVQSMPQRPEIHLHALC